MMESLGEPELALEGASSRPRRSTPTSPNINQAAKRLEQTTGDAEL